MKKVLMILIGCFLLIGCSDIESSVSDFSMPDISEKTEEGKVVMTMTDAAAEMENVQEIYVTVDNVEVYSETEGWVSLDAESETYALFELRDEARHELMVDNSIRSGQYSKVKIDVSKVTVLTTDGEVKEATMPKNEIEVDLDLDVESNETTTASFDIIADESLHLTEDGKTYVLAPIIDVETRSNADVDVSDRTRVVVSGGQVRTAQRVGMDIAGNVGVGLKIGLNERLEVNSVLGSLVSVNSVGTSNSDSNAKVNSNTRVETGNGNVNSSMEVKIGIN